MKNIVLFLSDYSFKSTIAILLCLLSLDLLINVICLSKLISLFHKIRFFPKKTRHVKYRSQIKQQSSHISTSFAKLGGEKSFFGRKDSNSNIYSS